MGIYGEVEQDMLRVFERWANREAPYFESSRRAFEAAVRPRACYAANPSQLEVEHMNLCYTEWFLFEYPLRGERSPLECFVGNPPADVSDSRLARLRELSETQRFARFAIRDRSVETGDLLLVDLASGAELPVHAGRACRRRSWREGTLSMRVARVDGLWMHVGRSLFYDRSPADAVGGGAAPAVSEGWGVVGREPGKSAYLRFLHDVIGLGGAYAHTARVLA